jgi:hypothetical protein
MVTTAKRKLFVRVLLIGSLLSLFFLYHSLEKPFSDPLPSTIEYWNIGPLSRNRGIT